MDEQEILHEQIEAYLGGKLPADELAAFEHRLQDDPVLQMETERHRKAAHVLRQGLRKERKAHLQDLDRTVSEQTTATVRTIRPHLFRRLAIAASILLVVAVGAHFYTHQTYSTDAVAMRLFSSAPEEVFRGREAYVTDLGKRFEEAESLFRKHEYAAAANAYLGIIRENTLQKEQAEWNLLLCYYAQDPASAKFEVMYDRILGDPQHQFHSEAMRLKEIMQNPLYRLVH